jgi:hypothetical protein
MKTRNLIYLLNLLLMSVACKTAMVTTPESFRGKQLLIGTGGGVTGLTTTWFILENGQVFRQESVSGEIKEMKKISKHQTSRVFEGAWSLELEKENFSHPGNMTSFITIKEPGKTPITVKWGDAKYPVPEKYSSFYQQTFSIVQPK